MEKSKPMELGLGELLSNQNIVNNNSFRFINRDLHCHQLCPNGKYPL